MIDTTEHNGWTNRATWVVNLWLTNEEPTYKAMREIAIAASSDMAAGDAIRDWLERSRSFAAPNLFHDLLTDSLMGVNWEEIGEHFREE